MLIIRVEQMTAFRRAVQESFFSRTAALLTAEFPAEAATLAAPAVIAWVETAVAVANSYDFLVPADIQQFLRCLIQLPAARGGSFADLAFLGACEGSTEERLQTLKAWVAAQASRTS